jgi:predicted nuclease of predicted toxin-antitoxin system
MKLLFDECVSRLFKSGFTVHGHECFTVPEVGLAGKKNGDLLTLAEDKFDVFVTIDKNIRYQQNLSGRKIAVLIIRARSSEIDDLLLELPACIAALQSIRPGQLVQIGHE